MVWKINCLLAKGMMPVTVIVKTIRKALRESYPSPLLDY
jgi:hypothetical protein